MVPGQGRGWYLPAIDELLTIGHNYNGGTRVQNNRQARNKFNDALKDAGGKRMDRLVYYFSSTEMDEKSAYTTHMGIEPPYVIEIPKYNKFLVRAVHQVLTLRGRTGKSVHRIGCTVLFLPVASEAFDQRPQWGMIISQS